jgi:G3E family GTPase
MAPLPAPLPVYLLTGFLGSGKTTLLSRLVRQPAFADTAVIINEFGAVGLDHVLLERSDDGDVVLLDSGCLCCASNNPLQDTLETLFYRRLRGEVPAFARVVVETSGLADPLPMINALHADVSMARHYRFAGVVTTVDAVHGLDSLERFQESALQVAVADRVVVTKTDLVSAAELDTVRAALAEVNATADVVVSAVTREADAPDLFGGLVFDPSRYGVLAAPAAARPTARFAHLLRYGIASHVRQVQAPVSWADYARWVAAAQRTLGERLLRVKGILRFDDGQHYAVHGVRHLFSTPQPLSGRIPEAQSGALVLITSDSSTEEVDGVMHTLQSVG